MSEYQIDLDTVHAVIRLTVTAETMTMELAKDLHARLSGILLAAIPPSRPNGKAARSGRGTASDIRIGRLFPMCRSTSTDGSTLSTRWRKPTRSVRCSLKILRRACEGPLKKSSRPGDERINRSVTSVIGFSSFSLTFSYREL